MIGIMTREEQFKEYLKVRNIPIDSLEADSIMEGIEWADEHPQGMEKMRKDYELLFLLKKKELIKKACEWMKSQTYQEWSGAPYERLISDEMIENFEKMMEE